MREESYPMLSVEDALQRVLSMFHRLEAEKVPLRSALGRVLAEDVRSDLNIPPHSNTAMDGYAVQAKDTAGASTDHPIRLRVVADLAAGYVADVPVTSGTAIRIMTGAPMPEGADAVVPFEDTELEGSEVRILEEAREGANVRLAGEDVKAGDLVLQQGRLIRAADIGMLASLGRAEVLVTRRPRVGILATGDELVEINEPLGPGKIRNSNSYSNAAQVTQAGGEPILLGIARDTIEDLTRKIREGLAYGLDLFLTSGGVSMGDFDVVKNVLAAEGEMTFWRVRMKPGKPLAFGQIGGVPLLGMPGNPVSVMTSFELFARPAIFKMLGRTGGERFTFWARLMEGIRRKDNRRHYLRVQLRYEEGEYRAYTTGDQGSGILNSMVQANGLAIIPEDWSSVEAGTVVPVMLLDGEA